MSGTVTQASSNLAAELLLNKIMNNQVETSTDRGITAAGRALSSRLNGEAQKLYAAESNMAYGEELVTAAQSGLSELKVQLENLRNQIAAVADKNGMSTLTFSGVNDIANDAFARMSAAAANSNFNGQKLLTGATLSLNAGNDMNIEVLGFNAQTVVNSVKNLNITNATAADTALGKVNAAISQLSNAEARYGATIQALSDRQALLVDQGASLENAAVAQSMMKAGGASNLLNAMLGNTEV